MYFSRTVIMHHLMVTKVIPKLLFRLCQLCENASHQKPLYLCCHPQVLNNCYLYPILSGMNHISIRVHMLVIKLEHNQNISLVWKENRDKWSTMDYVEVFGVKQHHHSFIIGMREYSSTSCAWFHFLFSMSHTNSSPFRAALPKYM